MAAADDARNALKRSVERHSAAVDAAKEVARQVQAEREQNPRGDENSTETEIAK